MARSGSQSQRAIWVILPAHGASHIIRGIKTLPNVKFSLYPKKAGLASRNMVQLLKNHSTLYMFLLFIQFTEFSHCDLLNSDFPQENIYS